MEISLDNGNLVAALIKQINLVQRWNKAYRKALNLPRPLAQNSLWLGTTLQPSPLRSTPQPLRFINVIKNHKSSHVKRNSIVLPPLLLCDSFCCRRSGKRGEGGVANYQRYYRVERGLNSISLTFQMAFWHSTLCCLCGLPSPGNTWYVQWVPTLRHTLIHTLSRIQVFGYFCFVPQTRKTFAWIKAAKCESGEEKVVGESRHAHAAYE